MTETGEIIRIASRGDGVTADGRHVPFAVPGDRLNPGGGLVHGPHHAEPPCPHFQLCGGCQLQHLDDETLKAFIRDRIIHAFVAQDIALPEFMPVHLSPSHSRRRVAVRSAWAGKQFQLGFSSEKSHRIVDLKQCDIMSPQLFALLQPLRTFLAPRIGPKRNVEIKLALVDQGVDVLIDNWSPDGLETHEAITAFATSNNLARLSTDDGYGPTTYWEPDPVTVTLGGIAVAYPPYGFLQATHDGEQALSIAVKEMIGDAQLVADLFSGLGTFAFAIASGRKIFAAEAERAALLAMKAAAGKAGLQVFAEHRDLFRRPLTPKELNRFAAVILDPPRAGAREQVSELSKSDVPKIAYVSCNPSSFARDAKTLIAAGYVLRRIWPVGQFRWSTHVELAGEFTRQ